MAKEHVVYWNQVPAKTMGKARTMFFLAFETAPGEVGWLESSWCTDNFPSGIDSTVYRFDVALMSLEGCQELSV